ncbi:glutathione-S-transferase [Gloeopeniophorella convolvens]|nr:glutathione-S-transferase [Gloeopeniophorella convolvens]
MAIPDANIFPHATGAAANTVDRHTVAADLVFYSGWFCPYVQRAWIALEEKKISYQYKEVNPYLKEKHFLEINPKGLVPAVEYKSKALYESLIILEFLEDAYPDTPRLLPADPFERAHARLWIDNVSKTIVPTFMRVLQAQEPDKQQAALQDHLKAIRAFAEQIKGPYFSGEQWGLVDTVVVPWIVRDWVLVEHRGYRREDVGPRWAEYAARAELRESVLNTTSFKEHLVPIYGRYLRNEAQSEAAKATREGRVIP